MLMREGPIFCLYKTKNDLIDETAVENLIRNAKNQDPYAVALIIADSLHDVLHQISVQIENLKPKL